MTLTGRVPLLLVLGVLALFVRPAGSTALWWVVAVLVLVVLDWLVAASPSSLRIARRPLGLKCLGIFLLKGGPPMGHPRAPAAPPPFAEHFTVI